MKINRKISPDLKAKTNFITKIGFVLLVGPTAIRAESQIKNNPPIIGRAARSIRKILSSFYQERDYLEKACLWNQEFVGRLGPSQAWQI